MTALKMFEKAMTMCGYTTADGVNGREDMLKKALTVINLVYADLYNAFVAIPGKDEEFSELESIHDQIELPGRILSDIMPYGVAMYLAQSESDADNQNLFAALYNRKRVGLVRVEKVKDTLPGVWG